MKIRLEAVGRGAKDLAAAERKYLERLKHYADVSIHELPEGRSKQVSQRLREEERAILAHAGSGFILFDQHGSLMCSDDWAGYFSRQARGSSHCFVIGGANGVSEKVKSEASGSWSLSRLTFPHQLVRLIVLEQLFRVFSMLKGHPYHRP